MTEMKGRQQCLNYLSLSLSPPQSLPISPAKARPANPSAVAQRQTVDVQLEELKRSRFCTDAAEKFWARHDWKNQHDMQNIVTYTSHYNKTLNKCLVDVHGVSLKDQGQVMESEHVYDAFEDTVIGGRVLLRKGGVEGAIQTVLFIKDGHTVRDKQETALVQPWFDTLMTQ